MRHFKFKVGDVVIVKEKVCSLWHNKGKTVIVQLPEDNSVTARDYGVMYKNDSAVYYFEERELDLYEEPSVVNQSQDATRSSGKFESIGQEVGALVDKKQKAYGNSVDKTYRLMQIYLEQWQNEDDTYTIPESLLKHILLQVRLIDKQNRLFNNPDADLMGENPYQDSVGYNLLGMEMVDNG